MAAALRSLSGCGGYSLLDHFGWVQPGVTRANDVYTFCTVYISVFVNLKLVNLCSTPVDTALPTLSTSLQNAVWLERESSEMLSVLYLGLTDTRKLLLDYSTARGVLHKLNFEIYSTS